MNVNDLIQDREATPLHDTGLETLGYIVHKQRSIRIIQGTECKCSSMNVDDLIQVRKDTQLLKPDLETQWKLGERRL